MRRRIKSFWSLFLSVWYIWAILFLAWFLFAINDQGKDFIYTVFLRKDGAYLIYTLVALVFWCFITWYSCSITFYDYTARGRINESHKVKMKFALGVGLAPILVLMIAIHKNALISTEQEKWAGYLLLFIFAVALYVLFNKLTAQKKSTYYPLYHNEDVVAYQHPVVQKKFLASRIQFIKENKGVWVFLKWYASFFIIVVVSFLFKSINYELSHLLMPPAILMLSLSMFIYIATVINLFHDNRKFPLIQFIVGWIVFSSIYNDNATPSRLIKNSMDYGQKRKDSLLPFFKQWLQVKLMAWEKDSMHNGKPMPIFLIANQGGGTRGSAWTSFVLQKLDAQYRSRNFSFYNQIFLMSGASGGGVGGGFYNAIKANQDSVTRKLVYDIWAKDHLTSVTASFSFGETLGSLLPWAITNLDRTKMLEYSWSRSFNKHVQPSKFGLDSSFLSMWYKDTSNRYKLPSVFINGTLAETGQKVIASNLVLDKAFLGKYLDYHAVTQKDFRYSTALTVCSRFPVLLSELKLIDSNGKAAGHILDGGLLENTATNSLLYFYEAIKPFIQKVNEEKKRVEVVILYIQNGGTDIMPQASSSEILRTVLNPLKGLYNSSGVGLEEENKIRLLETYIKQDSTAAQYFNIRLGRGPVAYPLGLYMSHAVLDQMVERLDFPAVYFSRYDSILQKDSKKKPELSKQIQENALIRKKDSIFYNYLNQFQ
jgi:hypothetical protein